MRFSDTKSRIKKSAKFKIKFEIAKKKSSHGTTLRRANRKLGGLKMFFYSSKYTRFGYFYLIDTFCIVCRFPTTVFVLPLNYGRSVLTAAVKHGRRGGLLVSFESFPKRIVPNIIIMIGYYVFVFCLLCFCFPNIYQPPFFENRLVIMLRIRRPRFGGFLNSKVGVLTEIDKNDFFLHKNINK